VARPFEEAFDAARGADLAATPRPFAVAPRPVEADAERLPVADEDRPLDGVLADTDFLLLAGVALRLLTEEVLLLLVAEERPEDEARPEDWLRDFFINVWFYNDD
jgi:hypothetical protein